MQKTIILGAGPAGLAVAYKISEEGKESLIIEKEKRVGGLSKSFKYKGFTFDIGPHLFKTRNKEITALWDVMSKKKYADNKHAPAMLYNKKVYESMTDIIYSLPKLKFLAAALSTLSAKIFDKKINSGEDWISATRGRIIYKKFYKPREEKFWGTSLDKIDKEWYEKRFGEHKLKGLFAGFKNRILGKSGNNRAIDTTYHPQKGAGSMYEALASIIKKRKKSRFIFNSVPEKIKHKGKKIKSIIIRNLKTGRLREIKAGELISSIPIMELIKKLEPKAPEEILEICKELKYRDLILVNLIAELKGEMKHSFFNVYSNDIKAFRITNFENLSEKMGNGTKMKPICIEYNCLKNDFLWNMNKKKIIEMAKEELEKIGFTKKNKIKNGFVVKIENAYPIHSIGFQEKTRKLREYLMRFENLQSIGRNGVFTYNQMRHSVESGLRAGEKALGIRKDFGKIETTDEGRDVLD